MRQPGPTIGIWNASEKTGTCNKRHRNLAPGDSYRRAGAAGLVLTGRNPFTRSLYRAGTQQTCLPEPVPHTNGSTCQKPFHGGRGGGGGGVGRGGGGARQVLPEYKMYKCMN